MLQFFASALETVSSGALLNDKNFKGTVFMPLDTAFQAALAALNMSPADLAANPNFVETVSKYHIIRNEPLEKKFLGNIQSKNTLLPGQSVTVSPLSMKF